MKTTRAFTLIEIMIVLAILALLIPITVFTFSSTRNKLQFNAEVSQVMQMLRHVRNLAISNREMLNPIVNFGVRFDVSVSPPKVHMYYKYLDASGNLQESLIETLVLNFILKYKKEFDSSTIMDENKGISISFFPPYGDVEITKLSDRNKVSVAQVELSRDSYNAIITINNVAGIPERF